MSRLVTIGCSLTEYAYPTWADMVGTHFDEYYNLGNPGCGHNYMLNIFTEADLILKLGKGDTVIVMSTSMTRSDVFLPQKLPGKEDYWGWQGSGNVWHKFKDDPTFLKRHYSNTYAVMQTLSSLKSIKDICNYKNINFILLKGFSTEPILSEQFETINLEFFKNRIDNLFEKNYAKSFYERFTNEDDILYGYEYDDTEQIDHHPTITQHNSFLKDVLPQYAISDEYVLMLEKRLDLSSQENNRNLKIFEKMRGKKLGSLITRDFSNYNMKNFIYSD